MNRMLRASLPSALFLALIFLSGAAAWGQPNRFPAAEPAFDAHGLNGSNALPHLEIDPPTINFGNVTIGGQSCVTATIRNSGTDSINLTQIDPLRFPFAPGTMPPVRIPPGESIQVQICFAPITTQDFFDTLALDNGPDQEPTLLTVEGKGLKVVTNIGPVLQVVSVDFDTAECGFTKCRQLTLRNVGTDPMNVIQVDSILAPFAGSVSPSPVVIQANEEQTFTICYTPESVPSRDSATITIYADNRVPLSIAAVFDISGSMNTPFGNFGSNRISAANAAGQSFLGNLVNDPGRNVIDEGAVYRFGDTDDFLRLQNYTTDRTLLRNAVPEGAFADFTCIYDAVVRVSEELSTRNIPGRRVMVLLTDGENTCTNSALTLDDAIEAAKDAGVTVYTIGIGTISVMELTELAEETGGFFSEAIDPTDLLESYQRIANDLSKSQPSFFTIAGRAVAPDLEISTTDIEFDSVRIGNNRCRTFTLRNTGDATLSITSFDRPSTHFNVTPTVIPDIPPGDSVTVQACFAPGRLREIDSILTFGYTHCTPQSQSVTLHGTGYDSIVVEMDGTFDAQPGTIISVPIRLVGKVPALYQVDSLQLIFAYNKTVLFPETPAAPLTTTGSAAAVMTAQQAEPTYDPQNATLTVTLSGGRLNSTQGDTLLAELRMMALHGNSLTTPVELMGATFADGNPKVGFRSETNFLADSLCFQEERLIDASDRFGPMLKLVAQQGNRAAIRIMLPSDGRARGDLFDQLGRHVGVLFDEVKAAGQYETTVDLSGLPNGGYWLRFQLNDDAQAALNIMVRN